MKIIDASLLYQEDACLVHLWWVVTARRFLPLRRRRLRVSCPDLVEFNLRKPCLRIRFFFLGFQVSVAIEPILNLKLQIKN